MAAVVAPLRYGQHCPNTGVPRPTFPCQGLSIACSTPEALKWDPEWENMHEIRWVGGCWGGGLCTLPRHAGGVALFPTQVAEAMLLLPTTCRQAHPLQRPRPAPPAAAAPSRQCTRRPTASSWRRRPLTSPQPTAWRTECLHRWHLAGPSAAPLPSQLSHWQAGRDGAPSSPPLLPASPHPASRVSIDLTIHATPLPSPCLPQ